MPIHMSIRVPIHMSVRMSIHMSVCMSAHMSTHMSAHMSMHTSAHMSIHMSVNMSTHVCTHVCTHVHTHVYTHECKHVYTHVYHTYLNTCLHTCLHTRLGWRRHRLLPAPRLCLRRGGSRHQARVEVERGLVSRNMPTVNAEDYDGIRRVASDKGSTRCIVTRPSDRCKAPWRSPSACSQIFCERDPYPVPALIILVLTKSASEKNEKKHPH